MHNIRVDGDSRAFVRSTRLAETTRATYSYYIDEFLSWAGEQRLAPADLSACDVLDWIDDHADWASSTSYSAATAIRAYFAWRFGKSHDVAQNAKVRRQDCGPQRTLDWEQLTKVFESLDMGTAKGIRDRALVALLVDTGLREAEVCRAELHHWNRREHKIDVLIKGSRWDVAEYFEATAVFLDAWRIIRDEFALPKVKTIFVSVFGKTAGASLTCGGLRAIFRQIGRAAGIGPFSPHDLRRTFATLASRAGAPTRVIQVAGRWNSLEMVERYTRALRPSDLKPYSPMDRLIQMSKG